MEQDMVKNPAHYQHPSGVETKEIVYPLPMWLGSSIKYAMRRDKKGKPIEDRRKAIETLCGDELADRLLEVAVAEPEHIVEKAKQVLDYERGQRNPDMVVFWYMDAIIELLDEFSKLYDVKMSLNRAKSLLEDEIERLAETN